MQVTCTLADGGGGRGRNISREGGCLRPASVGMKMTARGRQNRAVVAGQRSKNVRCRVPEASGAFEERPNYGGREPGER